MAANLDSIKMLEILKQEIQSVCVIINIDFCIIPNSDLRILDGSYQYNNALFQTLKEANIKQVFLLVSSELEKICKKPSDEATGKPSKLKLINHLHKEFDIKVRGVITNLDPIYNQGLGAYYEKAIRPYEALVLDKKEDLENGSNKDAYDQSCADERKIRGDIHPDVLRNNLFNYIHLQLQMSVPRSILGIIVMKSIKTEGDRASIKLLRENYELLSISNRIVTHPSKKESYNEYLKQFFDFVLKSSLCSLKKQATSLMIQPNDAGKDGKEDVEISQVLKELQDLEQINDPKYSVEQLAISLRKTMFNVGNISYHRRKGNEDNNIIEPTQNEIELKSEREKERQLTEEIHKLIAHKIEGGKAFDESLYTTVYGLEKPRVLKNEIAQALMSINTESIQVEKDLSIKTISRGQNRVNKCGKVFYKSGTQYSFIEQAVRQLSILIGGDIIAPTQLLIFKNVIKQSIDKFDRDFNKIGEGIQLNENLVPIQASLEIKGPSLDEILFIPLIINKLKNIMGDKKAIEALNLLLSFGEEKSFNEWLLIEKLDKNTSWEEQCKILIEYLSTLSSDKWPNEINLDIKDLQNRQIIEKQILTNRGMRGNIFLLLRIIKHECFEILMKDEFLTELMCFSSFSENLRLIYPNQSLENIFKLGPSVASLFDEENLNRHFILTLLTNPADHKADNFKVLVTHGSDGKDVKLKLVGIDNDEAFVTPIKSEESKEGLERHHIVNTKTILYAEKLWQNVKLTNRMKKRILSWDPEIIVLQWLSFMVEYCQEYEPLFARYKSLNKTFDEGTDKRKDKDGHPIAKMFNKNKLTAVLARLQAIQAYVKDHASEAISHEELMHEIEPLVDFYYKKLREKYKDGLTLLDTLYYKKNLQIFEFVLIKGANSDSAESIIVKEKLKEVKNESFQYLDYFDILKDRLRDEFEKNNLWVESLENKIDAKCINTQYGIVEILLKLKRLQRPIPVQELTLSHEVFSALYRKYQAEFIQWLKTLLGGVFLRFESPMSRRIHLTNSQILFYALRATKDRKLLVEGLLDFGVSVAVSNTYDGSTPLHTAAEIDHNIIPEIASYLRVNAKDILGRTALDRAIECRNLASVENLLSVGAGEELILENGKIFIEYYSQAYPKLCQQILKLNAHLTWELALEKVGQGKETDEKICLATKNKKERYLTSEVYKQIFKQGKLFSSNVAEHGSHPVTQVKCNVGKVVVGLHIKEKPQFPGREIMVHYLAKELFGFITPFADLWRFSVKRGGLSKNKEDSYPVIATRLIEGDNFSDLINKHPERLEQLEEESLSRAIILAMLINPEDGRADNYMVEPIEGEKTKKYKLFSIDNDHAFVTPVAEGKETSELTNTRDLHVKTILFCLNQMRKPVHPRVIEKIAQIRSIKNFLLQWIDNLTEYQDKMNILFNLNDPEDLEVRNLLKQNIKIKVEFSKGIVADLYDKLNKMQYYLKEDPNISHMDLLRRVIPAVGFRYAAVFSKHVKIQDRFDALTKGCFGRQIIETENKVKVEKMFSLVQHYDQMDKITLMLSRKNSKNKSKDDDAISHNPIPVKTYLETLDKEEADLKNIAKELQEGIVSEKFLSASTRSKEKILNGDHPGSRINFGDMVLPTGELDLKRQEAVLKAFCGVPLSILRIESCAALSLDLLKEILESSKKSIIKIYLKNCPRITKINFLERLCGEQLETFEIVEMPIEEISGTFFNLRSLFIRRCDMLKKCILISPELKNFVVEDCRQLFQLITQSEKIESMSLIDCDKLQDGHITRMAECFARITEVVIKNCKNIKRAEWYQSFPGLLMLPREQMGSEFINQLEDQIEKIANELKLTMPLKPEAIKSIYGPLLSWIKVLESGYSNINTLPLPELLKFRDHFKHKQECLSLVDQKVYQRFFEGLKSENAQERFSSVEGLAFGFWQRLDVIVWLPRVCSILFENIREKRGNVLSILKKIFQHSNIYTNRQIISFFTEKLIENHDLKSKTEIYMILLELFEHLSPVEKEVIYKNFLPLIGQQPDKADILLGGLNNLFQKKEMLDKCTDVLKITSDLKNANDNFKFKMISFLGGLFNKITNIEDKKRILGSLLEFLKEKSTLVKMSAVDTLMEEIQRTLDNKILLEPACEELIIEALIPLLQDKDIVIKIKALFVLSKLKANEKQNQELLNISVSLINENREFDKIVSALDALLSKMSRDSKEFQETLSCLVKKLDQKDGEKSIKILPIVARHLNDLQVNQVNSWINKILSIIPSKEDYSDDIVFLLERGMASSYADQLKKNLQSILLEGNPKVMNKIIKIFKQMLVQKTVAKDWIHSIVVQNQKLLSIDIEALELILMPQVNLSVELQKEVTELLNRLIQHYSEKGSLTEKLKFSVLLASALDVSFFASIREKAINTLFKICQESINPYKEKESSESGLVYSHVGKTLPILYAMLDKSLSNEKKLQTVNLLSSVLQSPAEDRGRLKMLGRIKGQTIASYSYSIAIIDVLLKKNLFHLLDERARNYIINSIVQVLEGLKNAELILSKEIFGIMGKLLFHEFLLSEEREKITLALEENLNKSLNRSMLMELHGILTTDNLVESLTTLFKLNFQPKMGKKLGLGKEDKGNTRGSEKGNEEETRKNNEIKKKKYHIVNTLADGNCGLNAVALGIANLVAEKKSLPANFCKKISEILKLDSDSLESIRTALSKLTNEQCQKQLAPGLRILAIQQIESRYDEFKSRYHAQLTSAFDGFFSRGVTEETYCVHHHIRKKFDELRSQLKNDLMNVKSSAENGAIREKHSKQLIEWWEKEGKNVYFKILSDSARSASDVSRWTSDLEIHALAFSLEIGIKVIVSTGSSLQGVGYGFIKNLSPGDVNHFSAYGLGSHFEGLGFRIEIADRAKLESIINTDRLSPAEQKIVIEKKSQVELLKFMNGSVSVRVEGVRDIRLLTEKLKAINAVTIGSGNQYRFVNEQDLVYRITPLTPEMCQILRTHHKPDVPCFSVKYHRNHWSFVRGLEELERVQMGGDPMKPETAKPIVFSNGLRTGAELDVKMAADAAGSSLAAAGGAVVGVVPGAAGNVVPALALDNAAAPPENARSRAMTRSGLSAVPE